MQKSLVVLFFVISAVGFAQQDRAIFPEGQATWFAHKDSIFLYYNDSTFLENDRQVHLFGQKYLYEVFGECTEEILPEFWQGEGLDFVLETDTLYSLDSEWYLPINNDTLYFFPDVTVGDSWFLPTAQQDSFLLTCISCEPGTIYAYEDSLKTFELQFIQEGAVTPHPLNGETFALGKNVGFTRFYFLDDLYFSSETAMPVEIIGFEKDAENYAYTSVFDDYFKYQVGDIFKWHAGDRNNPSDEYIFTEEWFIDTVENISFSGGLMRLDVSRTIYTEVSENGVLTDAFTELDIDAVFAVSEALMDTFLLTPNHHPLQFFGNLRYRRGSPVFSETGIRDTAYFITPQTFDSADCSIEESNDWPGSFVLDTGLGLLRTDIDRGESGSSFIELLGYENEDFSWGDLTPVPIVSSTLLVAQEQLSVYPNPTSDFVNIDLPEGLATERFYLRDFLGKEILTGELSNSVTLDLENLPAGVYFITADFSGTSFTKKIVKY